VIELVLTAWAVHAALMFFAWLWFLKTGKAGVVDIAWSFGLPTVVFLYTLGGDGFIPKKLLALGLMSFWGFRLGFHLLGRVFSHEGDDPRYDILRSRWGSSFKRNMFFFFQSQALLNMILAVPFLLIANFSSHELRLIEVFALLIFILGFFGEFLSDSQLARFKAQSANKGEVCNVGLWRYSRHPNYFFEFVIWLGFGLLALGSSYGALGLVSPVLMFILLRYFTGVPPSEKQSLKTRGEKYSEYQEQTSVFFPWFPKNVS
jgi:steroid 5-alpha reductase family enzyme